MKKIVRFYTYRQAMGNGILIAKGDEATLIMSSLIGNNNLDNHIAVVILYCGYDYGYYYSDHKLWSVDKLVAGDTNSEIIGAVLWTKSN